MQTLSGEMRSSQIRFGDAYESGDDKSPRSEWFKLRMLAGDYWKRLGLWPDTYENERLCHYG